MRIWLKKDIVLSYDLTNYPVDITNKTIEWDNATISETVYTIILPNKAVLEVSFLLFILLC